MDKFLNTVQLILFSLMLVFSLVYVFVIEHVGFKIGALIVSLLVAKGIKYIMDERKNSKDLTE